MKAKRKPVGRPVPEMTSRDLARAPRAGRLDLLAYDVLSLAVAQLARKFDLPQLPAAAAPYIRDFAGAFPCRALWPVKRGLNAGPRD